jgi:AAA domain
VKKPGPLNPKSPDATALVEFIQAESTGPVSTIFRPPDSPSQVPQHSAIFVARGDAGDNIFSIRNVAKTEKRTVADQIHDFAKTLGIDQAAAAELIDAGLTLKDACDELISLAADQRRTRIEIPDLLSVQRLLDLKLVKPRAYIENLLHEGETVAVAGRPKVGKSRLVMQMALALVNGESFLGCKITRPLTVLMVDFENRLAALSERFRLMNGSAEGYKRLYIWSAASLASDLPDATTEGQKRLLEYVEQVRPDVLIVDPWRLWLGGDENSAPDVVRGLKILASLRERLPHLAIIIVHHVRKEKFENPRQLIADPSLWSDSLSGHHALMSHVDACFGLERTEDLIVFGGIARNAEPSTLILDEEVDLRFKVAGNEAAALKVMTEAQTLIWAAATSLRKFTFTALLKKAKTTNKKAVAATLRTAENHGLINHSGDQYIVLNPKVG